MQGGGLLGADLFQHRIPDRITGTGSQDARGQRIHNACLGGVRGTAEEQPGDQHQWQAAQEVAGGIRQRIGRALAQQRIGTPGDAGCHHQQRAGQCRRIAAGEQQKHQAGEGQQHADDDLRAQRFATQPAAEEHGDLHRAKQDQRPRPGTQLQVGQGKQVGVAKQRQAAFPAAPQARLRLAQLAQAQQEKRAAAQADGGERARVDIAAAQGHAAEQRVGGEGDQADGGGQCPGAEGMCRWGVIVFWHSRDSYEL